VVLRLTILSLLSQPASVEVEDNATGERTVPAVPSERFRVVIVRTSAIELEILRPALVSRLPELEILPYDNASFAHVEGRPFAYVELLGEDHPKREVSITIILSDGRAYLRRFEPDSHDRVRSIAVTLTNTLTAIAEEGLEPDRYAQPVPVPVSEPEAPVELRRMPPVPTRPERKLERRSVGEPEAPAELAISIPVVTTFGLAPISDFASWGGGARLDVRLRNGFAMTAGFRAAGRSHADVRLMRLRTLTGLGYAWRRGSFELVALAVATIEPWFVTRDGTPEHLTGQQETRSLLIGAAMIASPGFHVQPRSAPRINLRLGVHAELAASVLPSGAAARVYSGGSSSAAFTLGGFEISLGADFTLWFELQRSR